MGYHPLVSKVGIVIPTAFGRPEYLPLAYQSILNQVTHCEIEIIVGCPEGKLQAVRAAIPGAHVIAEDSSPGLAHKLHSLLLETSSDCKYITWLGDDDLLTPGSLAACINALDASETATLAYGGCDYIDADGQVMFTNPASPLAAKILNFGPQLIPQPGSLIRRESYVASGGLSNDFALAFDFDLFIQLKKLGPILFVPKTLAQFRWHPESLSVKRRMRSALEASKVRRKHYGFWMGFFWPLWEPIVIMATWLAGKLVTIRYHKRP